MAEILGTKLGEWFFKNHVIQKSQIDDIRFGFESLCSEILEFLVILSYGMFTHRYIETIVYIILFRTLRKFMDGYHAKTIWRCFVLTVGSYLLTMTIYPFVNVYVGMVLFSISIVIQAIYQNDSFDKKLLWVFTLLHIAGLILYINIISYSQILLLVSSIVSVSWLPERREKR